MQDIIMNEQLITYIHPRPENIAKVAAYFRSLADKDSTDYPLTVDLGQGHIMKSGCGTVACHAGYYALKYFNEQKMFWGKAKGLQEYKQFLFNDSALSVTFREGMELMAKDLGFSSSDQLTSWAYKYPEIWGNRWGGYMFGPSGRLSFGIERYSMTHLNMDRIATHWELVEQNMKKFIEEANSNETETNTD